MQYTIQDLSHKSRFSPPTTDISVSFQLSSVRISPKIIIMSLNLWPSDVYESTGSSPENIDAICEAIHEATKGFGTNEKYVQRDMLWTLFFFGAESVSVSPISYLTNPIVYRTPTIIVTTNRALLHALGSQTPTDRCYVSKRYEALYEKPLIDVIRSECGNKPFGLTLQYLSVPPDVAECHMIHDACDGYV